MSHTKDGGPSGAPLDAGEEENCEEEDDVSRFRSLDLPTSRRTEATTRAEFSETCLRGQFNQVAYLVERGGIDLTAVDDDGRTVVHICARHRYCNEVLRYLLEKGVGASDSDNVGATPLHAAASSRNVAGIEQLLQFGAKVDVKDKSGCTPLFAACKAIAHRAIVELLKGEANAALVNGEDDQTALHALLVASQGKKSSRKSRENFGPPSTSAALSLRETVDCLVKAGAPLMVTDRSGRTIFDEAAACDAELVHHMLLECNVKSTEALSLAIRHGDTVVAKELLDGGKVDPCTVIDCMGRSLLHVAAAHANLDCVKVLLTGEWLQRADAVPLNVDARDTAGRTALFIAAHHGFVDIAAFLLDLGASPAIRAGSGVGVGYTFSETSTAEGNNAAVCELLARWGARGEEERKRAASSMSVKAPDGDVVFFTGAVAFVHNTKTNHLWGPARQPPSPIAAEPTQALGGLWVGSREHGTNPWRGKKVADSFQPISSGNDDCNSPTLDAMEGESKVGGSAENGGTGRRKPVRGAAKYVAENLNPREGRWERSPSEENESELAERESRAVSEPGPAGGKTSARKLGCGDKGKMRRRRAQSIAPSIQGDMPADRPRNRSAATDSAGKHESTRPRATSPRGSESPRNQHRKLKVIPTREQPGPANVAAAAINTASGTSSPATVTATATPSAPAARKPSRLLKTFW